MTHVIDGGPVVVIDFTGVYDHERFARRPGIVRLDCRHLDGTDCYCDAEGATAIRRLIAPYPPEGIHYISIDKDILSPQTVRTNWDQGHVALATLKKHLHAILAHERVIGIDICGECSALLDFAEEEAEARQNNTVNEKLLNLLRIAREPTCPAACGVGRP